MGVPKQKIDWPLVGETPRGPVLAGQMPARALQELLGERNNLFAEPHIDRWSQRRALAFIVASAAALWVGMICAAHAAVTAIA